MKAAASIGSANWKPGYPTFVSPGSGLIAPPSRGMQAWASLPLSPRCMTILQDLTLEYPCAVAVRPPVKVGKRWGTGGQHSERNERLGKAVLRNPSALIAQFFAPPQKAAGA
jgi:hypothetical protein